MSQPAVKEFSRNMKFPRDHTPSAYAGLFICRVNPKPEGKTHEIELVNII